MSKLRAHISVSADGYVAGPNQSKEDPLGEGGESLHDWLVANRAWREPHVGAEIMGRGKFGGGPGPWGARLFEGVGPEVGLELLRAVEAPGVTHVKYRVAGT